MMAHKVLCRTIDEVNGNIAQDWGEKAGLNVQITFPKETLLPADTDGLVIDLDHLGMTRSERAQLLRCLFVTLLPYPVAVIGNNLDIEQIEALRASGVLVSRRLEPALSDIAQGQRCSQAR